MADGKRLKKVVASIEADVWLEKVVEAQPEPASTKAATIHEYATGWFARRSTVDNKGDRLKYEMHLKPLLGHLHPDTVDAAFLKNSFILPMKKRLSCTGSVYSGATIRSVLAVLSSMYTDMVEDGIATSHGPKNLNRKTRSLLKSDYDPKREEVLRNASDIGRIFRALRPGIAQAFALGAMQGLRPGEIRGLDWSHVDWTNRNIVVQQQAHARTGKLTRLKDSDPRAVPILRDFEPILRAWHVASGSPKAGLVFRPLKDDTGRFLGIRSMTDELHAALKSLGLPEITWYAATRHSFGTQWVAAGGSPYLLKEFLGHADFETTQRYIHLAKDFRGVDRDLIRVDFANAELKAA